MPPDPEEASSQSRMTQVVQIARMLDTQEEVCYVQKKEKGVSFFG
jgi:hypothetical protein